ncbi:hypothetical protein HAX54_004123 [Datura stramonium]|uniref:Uncharacterized protein n=1 Tax=Datura stramonium TaxID=4076 RepID=A0ABS8WV50_DATST|nr:hypothetical protein [Datura stramonium]
MVFEDRKFYVGGLKGTHLGPINGLACRKSSLVERRLSHCQAYAFRRCCFAERRTMTSNRNNTDKNARKASSSTKSKSKGKGKSKDTPIPANTKESLCLCVEGMKPYFIKYRYGRSFTPEKSSNLAGLGNEFPNINRQFAAHD